MERCRAKHGSTIAACRSERARWLVALGLTADAGAVYKRAVAANPDAARRDAGLTFAGSMAAITADGAAGLRQFIKENGLANTTDQGSLLELADASLMVNDAKLAGEYVTSVRSPRPISCLKISPAPGRPAAVIPIY